MQATNPNLTVWAQLETAAMNVCTCKDSPFYANFRCLFWDL